MILRVCVVIPTYNNPRTITSVVQDVVNHTDFPVLVVDDGSETAVTNVIYSFDVKHAMEQGRVRIVRFDKNRGKGAALQYAIQDLVALGFTHMFTIDGDGQHLASQMAPLLDLAKEHPWDLIIGHRRFVSKTVPSISKFGRRFSNFWVQYQTGLSIHDSQSGFRLYPLFPLQNMKFRTRKYDFEIEVLIRLMWAGVTVRECDIDVIYPEARDRVSHFRKFRDNARISLLNTMLVTISLLRSHRDPKRLGIAAGLGVFIGCTPLFGFHTALVAMVAFAFRLNAIAMLLGSQVSMPFIAPLIILGSIYIGHHWLGVGLSEGAIGHFYQWLTGSMVMGTLLGLTIGFATYFSSRLQSERRGRATNWTGRTRGGRFGNGFLKWVLRHLGREWGYRCLYFIVPYFWIFAPKARHGLNEYYRLLYPRQTWAKRQGMILRHFFRFGQVLMDRLYQGFHGGQQFRTRPDGMQNILEVMKKGEGLIALSAHVGGWDLASALLGTHGFSDQIHVVEYQASGLNFQKVKDQINPDHVHTVNSNQRDDAIFAIHQALRQGRLLGLMGDRPLGDRFELIPFLGRLAPFDVTAFRLAAAQRTPLLFTFGFKAENGIYDFYARPARHYLFNGHRPRALELYQWAEEYVREVEYFVRKYPEQWFNFYPFWSALPMAPNGQLAGTTLATNSNCLLEELPIPTERELARELAPTPNDAP